MRDTHAKFEESNALAALSRALKASAGQPNSQEETPSAAAPEQPRPSSPKKHKRKKAEKEVARQGIDSTAPDHTAAETDGKQMEKKKKRKLSSAEGAALPVPAGEATPDPAQLCSQLSSLMESLVSTVAHCVEPDTNAASAAAATLQLAVQVAAQLESALERLGPASALEEQRVLQQRLQELGRCLQGQDQSAALAETYRPLQRSAAALQLATAAAQLAHSIAHPLVSPGAAGAQPNAGEGGEREFNTWYLSIFADCFGAELEALQEAEAPAPATVLRRCILAQTQLFPPPYQRLAAASTQG